MKRLIVATLCCFMAICAANAQTSGLSKDELQFRDGIEVFLKEEGFVPTIDTDDNSLNWKREGKRYWLFVHDTDPTYIEIHESGFNISADNNRTYLMEACNKACLETRCAKAYLTKTSVSFTIEVYCQTVEGFKNIFYRSISALDTAKEKTQDYYNELDK